MGLVSRIVLDVQSTQTSALDLETPASQLTYRKVWDLTSGSGANQANKKFSDTRTLTASSTEDIDLAGVLVDALGTTLSFTRVVALIISASSANTNNVHVICPAANGFITWCAATSDTVKVRPGGSLVLISPDATGYAVTAGTGDLLTITNGAGGTSVIYDIVIIGS